MTIFHNYRDHNYNAYLNWMFDDGDGGMSADPISQRIWDFKTMGRAYLENSKESLSLLLAQKNINAKADLQIFPILFGIWHGIELVLKSGNMLCDLYLNEEQGYSSHKIDAYCDQFLAKMKRLGFTKVERTHFSEMVQFIDECKENNAHFDFARYTEQANGEKQFYNKPDDDGFVRNSCIDMIELYRVLDEIIKKSVDCIDYLYDNLAYYGIEDKSALNDRALQEYTKQDEILNEKYPREESMVSLLEDNAKAMVETLKQINDEKEKS